MNPHTQNNNNEEEMEFLRRENKKLQAQLSFHRRIFAEVQGALENAENLQSEIKKNEVMLRLLEENEELKNRMKYNRLSLREKEILTLIKDGLTSREIGEQLAISKLTVDTHRKNIMSKLEADNTAALIRLAIICNKE